MVASTSRVSDRLHSVLGVRAHVTLVEIGSLERCAGEFGRGLDRRDMR